MAADEIDDLAMSCGEGDFVLAEFKEPPPSFIRLYGSFADVSKLFKDGVMPYPGDVCRLVCTQHDVDGHGNVEILLKLELGPMLTDG